MYSESRVTRSRARIATQNGQTREFRRRCVSGSWGLRPVTFTSTTILHSTTSIEVIASPCMQRAWWLFQATPQPPLARAVRRPAAPIPTAHPLSCSTSPIIRSRHGTTGWDVLHSGLCHLSDNLNRAFPDLSTPCSTLTGGWGPDQDPQPRGEDGARGWTHTHRPRPVLAPPSDPGSAPGPR